MNFPNNGSFERFERDNEIEDRFGVMGSWTLRFSLGGPDHLYVPKKISGTTTVQNSNEVVHYFPKCVAGHVELPLYFRSRHNREFHLRKKQGWGVGEDHIERFEYPELNLCESCARYWMMIELSL